MSGNYISTIIAERWKEAVAEPDVARWLSLSQLAAQAADSIAHHEPESILVASFKGIYEAAYGRALAMMKQEELA